MIKIQKMIIHNLKVALCLPDNVRYMCSPVNGYCMHSRHQQVGLAAHN